MTHSLIVGRAVSYLLPESAFTRFVAIGVEWIGRFKVSGAISALCSEDGGRRTINEFFRKRQTFNEYDPTIGSRFKTQGHLCLKPMPGIDLDGTHRDLARRAVEWTIRGLQVEQDFFMGLSSTIPDCGAAEFFLKRGESNGVDRRRTERWWLHGLFVGL